MGMFGSRIRRTRKTCLVPSFFFFLNNTENTKTIKNTKMAFVLYVFKDFSGTIFKNMNQIGPFFLLFFFFP